jgi:hypothetical protein
VQASNLAQAGDAFFALTLSMNMHGRAAAMVTPIGDKKRLLPAESAVSSSGCAGRGRLKSGSSRKKKWKHARLQGAQRREGVCVGLGCRGPECDFQYFPRRYTLFFSANGDGAWPQAHIHLNLGCTPSGSPPTKFGGFVTVCNRHSTLVHQGCFTFSDNDSNSNLFLHRARRRHPRSPG